MSLPPGFLDDLRTRVSLSSVVGRKVTWDVRKSNLGKGDMWAPCPFHQEKSPSFHVDDRKGFYYCFGCHAKGDAVTFIKETENLGFMEAVAVLAAEAGMPMPSRDPQAAVIADRRAQLQSVVEEAFKWFRLQLRTSAAADARAYLAKRGLSEAAQDRWEIGYAPDTRQGLFAALTQKGIAPDLIIQAGLCARPDDGKPPYDRFRGRITFPIRDGRGRAISLGGRAMAADAQAKYLNGPETELFNKGRNLYNQAPAREAAGKGEPLVVAEGYMDVIALAEAGFRAVVAPLGTAVTEDQLRLMWRISNEPIIALDGDTAGVKAALRVIDLALPLLEAGKGLRFAVMPGGMDPDDLIRAHGAGAMKAVLDSAQPMVRMIWQRETADKDFDSPERKASLRRNLREVISRLKDRDIKRYYADAFREFEDIEFRPKNWVPTFKFGKNRAAELGASSQAKRSMLAKMPLFKAVEYMRETAILAICLRYPHQMAPFESSLETLELLEKDHSTFLQVLLQNHLSMNDEELYGKVCDFVGRELVENLMSLAHITILPPIKNREDQSGAKQTLMEQLAKLCSERALRKEMEEAEEDLAGLADEGLTWRLTKATEARHRADHPTREDAADLGEDRGALSNHLQSLIDGRVWEKKNR